MFRGYADAHRPIAGTARTSMTGKLTEMRQTKTGEVHLDAGKSACFRASARPAGCFDCRARPLRAIYVGEDAGRSDPGFKPIGNPRYVRSICSRWRKMGFKISGNFGDRKTTSRISRTAAGANHVEVAIDDKRIAREQASRILRMMADRLLECTWPPDECPLPGG
jgi:hypothetical protein